jgi:hypothetical protein
MRLSVENLEQELNADLYLPHVWSCRSLFFSSNYRITSSTILFLNTPPAYTGQTLLCEVFVEEVSHEPIGLFRFR